jgi:hypothetical protein
MSPGDKGGPLATPPSMEQHLFIRVVSGVPMITGRVVAYGPESRDSIGAGQAAKLTTNQDTLRREWRSAFKNDLTEPTCLEMSGNACKLNQSMQHHLIS